MKKRITDADRLAAKLWRVDPFLPLAWRAEDARCLVAGERPRWSCKKEPGVAEYTGYLRSLDATKAKRRRSGDQERWAAIAAAHEFAQRNDPLRWEVEARLLAGQSDDEIGRRCGLPTDVVQQFERLFFNVRESLDARNYILVHAIGFGHLVGLGDQELNRLWRKYAYAGGVVVLDALVEAFHAAWNPAEPATISVYFRDDSPASVSLLANIAVNSIPRNAETDAVFQVLHVRLREAESAKPEGRAARLRDEVKDLMVEMWRHGPAAVLAKLKSQAKRATPKPTSAKAASLAGRRKPAADFRSAVPRSPSRVRSRHSVAGRQFR
ncbi:MAG: hypothetical protein NTY19_08120 [Planctomycetota bacterium]|nr:hypothetical protein [Planctomycetota bacterium]